MLTKDVVQELRKPFAPEQIKWKVQTNPKEGQDMAIVVAYIDSRDVSERLDLATGGDWGSEFYLPQVQAGSHHSLECALTVCGVTRRDVGTVPGPRQNEDSTKDLYSDALKRAAVQFGVGSHVYRFPKVKAKVQQFGKSFMLTFRAQDELLMLNRALIEGKQPGKYTEIKVSGSSYGAGGTELFDDEPAEAEKAKPTAYVANAPASADEAAQRFYTRYSSVIGGSTWRDVQAFLRSRAPQPETVDGWIEVAQAVRDAQKQDAKVAA